MWISHHRSFSNAALEGAGQRRIVCNLSLLSTFGFPATATGVRGLGECTAQEEASREAGAGPATGSSGWGDPGLSHRDRWSVGPGL